MASLTRWMLATDITIVTLTQFCDVLVLYSLWYADVSPSLLRLIIAFSAHLSIEQTVASRVAEEAGVKLGGEVGYTIRFEDQTNPV